VELKTASQQLGCGRFRPQNPPEHDLIPCTCKFPGNFFLSICRNID